MGLLLCALVLLPISTLGMQAEGDGSEVSATDSVKAQSASPPRFTR